MFDRRIEKLVKKSKFTKGRLGQTGFTQLLENEASLMWVGTVLMGQAFTPMNVVFDTGSDWLVV
jgi:hypothetical protein